MSDDNRISLRLHGPDVTAEHALEVGEQWRELLDSVGTALYGDDFPGTTVAALRVACDAPECEATRPFDDATGWKHEANGDDFCPVHA